MFIKLKYLIYIINLWFDRVHVKCTFIHSPPNDFR
jgi:hypothetical protein